MDLSPFLPRTAKVIAGTLTTKGLKVLVFLPFAVAGQKALAGEYRAAVNEAVMDITNIDLPIMGGQALAFAYEEVVEKELAVNIETVHVQRGNFRSAGERAQAKRELEERLGRPVGYQHQTVGPGFLIYLDYNYWFGWK